MREAREELGVNVSAEKVWGILKPLRDMVSVVISESRAPTWGNLMILILYRETLGGTPSIQSGI